VNQDVPILLIAFRRPDLTVRVLEAIARHQPTRLYLAIDAAREGNDQEALAVAATSRLLREGVNWPCQVNWLLQPHNLGCRAGVLAALDWFFAAEPEGIILEDDILPGSDFFYFCCELLEFYRHDATVGVISGCSVGRRRESLASPSYRFSRFQPVWGWASWRRAWQLHRPDLSGWLRWRGSNALANWGGRRLQNRMTPLLDSVLTGNCDTWDYDWFLSCWQQGLRSAIPQVNLVSNLGFGSNLASHCKRGRSPLPPPATLSWPLRHPPSKLEDPQADRQLFERLYAPKLPMRIWRRCGQLLPMVIDD
jgi:hypothetical protein